MHRGVGDVGCRLATGLIEMAIDHSFLGTGWAFPPMFDSRSKQAALSSGVQDVEESLRILLSTTPGERVMQPSYGCNLRAFVFEAMDESRITELRDMVEKAVLFFEVRVTLDEVQVEWADWTGGVLNLHLHYTVRSTNTRHNLVYPLYLREGTGVGLSA
jgi:uncharacterized protein